jgi:nucleoside-diphosphate-sugar epimerase
MRIAITGSNGFIGGELTRYFIAAGDEVLLLQRKRPEQLPGGTTYQMYDLSKPEALPNLDMVDALIHTAYMPFTATNHATEKNIEGTLALYNLCLSKGVQFIFLSSMSAHANALSQYGKHKFELERQMDSNKCLILKPGLVIGRDGLFSRIRKSFEKMPFSVLVGGGKQPIQTVYVGDLIKVIAKGIHEKRTGIYTVATTSIYTMRELFTAIAAKVGKRPMFISVPYWMVNLGIGVITFLHLPFPVSSENVLGLKQLQPVDTSADLEKLGITLLDLKQCVELL